MSKAPLWHDNIISIISLWRALFHWINKRRKVGNVRTHKASSQLDGYRSIRWVFFYYYFYFSQLFPWASSLHHLFLDNSIGVLVPNSGKLCCSSFPRKCLVPPAWCLLFHMSLLFGRSTGCPHIATDRVCVYIESRRGAEDDVSITVHSYSTSVGCRAIHSHDDATPIIHRLRQSSRRLVVIANQHFDVELVQPGFAFQPAGYNISGKLEFNWNLCSIIPGASV